MVNKEFLKLIKLRKQWIESTKANGFDFSPLLAGQYNDPSHFIYEILQNAEDANAKKISFQLSDDYLEIIHNGKDFDYNDVDGITGIGISTKKEDINKIGKFGVGFKSVFAVTETPRIYSGQYDFEIQDFVVPKLLKNSSKINETKIILPFNHRKRSREEVYSIVENKLENIGLTTLLFLSNIQVIEWKSKLKNGKYFKKTAKFSNFENVKKVEIFLKNEELENLEKYIVIHRYIKIDEKKLKIEIAFKISKNKENSEIIIPVEDCKLVVFFPTEKITFLNFLIQGPFKTTSNRENIPLDDEQNNQLTEEIAELAADSLAIIKKLNLLNVDFLQILPLSEFHSTDIIYSKIFKRIRKEFLTGEALLPTSTSGFSKPEDALLARGKDLLSFLNKSDISFLFDKKNWLDSEITYDRTGELRDYILNELDIKEIDFSEFAEKITEDFMKRKKDSWIITFYGKLLDQRSLWEKTNWNEGILIKKSIIRLKNGSHIAPFDQNGKIQVYLPTGITSKYKTVKDTLLKNKKSLEFLKQLGLLKPDIYSEIKEFILPKYLDAARSVNKEYYEDFKKIMEAFEKIPDDKKNELIKDIKELSIIACSNINSDKKFIKKPSEVYLTLPNVLEYFDGYEEVYSVDKNLEEKILDVSSKSDFYDFLIKIGCNECPKRIPFDADLSYQEKYDLRKNSSYKYDKSAIDYDYEGLDNFLNRLSIERSIILWNFLLNNIKKEQVESASNFFKGNYTWNYRKYDESALFDSKFLKTLKNISWLYDTNKDAKKPRELSPLDLNDSYLKDSKDSEHLIEILGLIPDPIKLYAEKMGLEMITKEEYEEYILLKAEKASIEENKPVENINEDWEPEIMPDSLKPKVVDLDLPYIKSPDLEYRNFDPQKIASSQGETDDENSEKTIEPKSSEKLKLIGRWGETLVFKALKDRFNDAKELQETEFGFKAFLHDGYIFEVKWLNKSSDFGRGYDFVIIRDEIEVEYIEVKSKVSDKDELIEITGTQWEFARKLYNEGNGNNYYIYVVQNSGSPNAIIKIINNPISLWYSGKLYAHPICFKL